MRCTNAYREGARSTRRCIYRKQRDLDTLVSTRTELPAVAPGVEAHVSSFWKPTGHGRVRIAE
jgi:hypothetical protein